MKKIAGPEQQAIVDMKLRDIQESVNGHIAQMNNLLKQPQPNLKEILMELNNNAAAMSRMVSQKTLELKSMIIAPPPVTTTTPTPPAAEADDKAQPTTRKKEPSLIQKMWGKVVDVAGGDQVEQSEPNAVAGVRGERKDDLTATAKHPTPRQSEDNKNLPDFWRRNFDYGESPYMHMDKIKTITERPISKRKRKKKK